MCAQPFFQIGIALLDVARLLLEVLACLLKLRCAIVNGLLELLLQLGLLERLLLGGLLGGGAPIRS